MEISLVDLWAAWPGCSLCCFKMFSPSSPPLQLTCKHLFCSSCIASLWSGEIYTCPWDGVAGKDMYFDAEIQERMQEVCAQGNTLTKQAIGGYFYWFEGKISRKDVPCRNFFVTHSCAAVHCCSSHDENTWQVAPCPLWDSCHRSQWCPYRHSWTPPKSAIASGKNVFSTMKSVNLPQMAIVGDERDGACLYSLTSTINLSTFLKKGQIVLRSKSLVKLLLANESQLLTAMAGRHNVQVKLNLSKVKYLSMVQWVYYEPPHTRHFKEYDSMQLEAAYQCGSQELALGPDTHIYFPLMLCIASEWYCQIDRYERVTSSTDAAVVVVEARGEGIDAMSAEIQSYESSVELGDRACCRNLCSFLKKYGLGVTQDKIYGTNSDLTQAFAEMDQMLTQQQQTIYCSPIPVGVDSTVVSTVAAQLGVQFAVYDVRVFGTEQTIAALMQQIYSLYESVPVPSNITQAALDNLCSKHNLTLQGQYLCGLKEKVVLALADLAESSVPIPAGLAEDQILEVIQHFEVRREGAMLLGPRDEVNSAFRALEQADQSAACPKHLPLPQIQPIAQKFNLRIANDRLYGPPIALLKALDTLNSLPSMGDFQYHQPPTWLHKNKRDLKVVDLQPGNEEYRAVEALFLETAHYQVIRIQEIQNRRLYTNFAYKHEGYSRIENRPVLIKRLFHGTRSNTPKEVYESDEGLDSRLGKGAWGFGSYFAAQSQYSTAYAHTNKEGDMMMFLCEVIVGDFVQLSPNSSLRKPPLKPNTKSAYHSVQGYGGGSEIWITYEPAMSYPRFLITYV